MKLERLRCLSMCRGGTGDTLDMELPGEEEHREGCQVLRVGVTEEASGRRRHDEDVW